MDVKKITVSSTHLLRRITSIENITLLLPLTYTHIQHTHTHIKTEERDCSSSCNTSLFLSEAAAEQILWPQVAVEPLRLEELDPEIFLLHLVGDQLAMSDLHRGIGAEDGLDHFVGDTQLHGVAAVGAVGHCLQLRQERRRQTCFLI